MLTNQSFNNFLALAFIKKNQLCENTRSSCAFCDNNQGYYHFSDVQYKTLTESPYSYNSNICEGMTESICTFCDNNQGYYYFSDVQYKTFTESNFTYNYYICEDVVDYVFQYIETLLLIKHLCLNYTDYDVYKYMAYIYHNTHTKAICLIQQEKLLEKRMNYLNINLTNMTNKELRLLMNDRKIKINGCKVKADYINKIKNDIEIKKIIWHID